MRQGASNLRKQRRTRCRFATDFNGVEQRLPAATTGLSRIELRKLNLRLRYYRRESSFESPLKLRLRAISRSRSHHHAPGNGNPRMLLFQHLGLFLNVLAMSLSLDQQLFTVPYPRYGYNAKQTNGTKNDPMVSITVVLSDCN